MGPILPWAMEASQENFWQLFVASLTNQYTIKQAEVPLTAPRSLPAWKQCCQEYWSSFVPLPAERPPAVPSAGGQSCVIAEGCKRAADYRAQLRDIVRVPAGWCITAFRAPKVRRSEHSGKLDPWHREAHCKQVLVFWGRHVQTFGFNCKRQTRMPTRWQQAGPLQAHELQSPAQARKKKKSTKKKINVMSLGRW